MSLGFRVFLMRIAPGKALGKWDGGDSIRAIYACRAFYLSKQKFGFTCMFGLRRNKGRMNH